MRLPRHRRHRIVPRPPAEKEHFAELAVDAVLRLKGSTNLDAIQVTAVLRVRCRAVRCAARQRELRGPHQRGRRLGLGTACTVCSYQAVGCGTRAAPACALVQPIQPHQQMQVGGSRCGARFARSLPRVALPCARALCLKCAWATPPFVPGWPQIIKKPGGTIKVGPSAQCPLWSLLRGSLDAGLTTRSECLPECWSRGLAGTGGCQNCSCTTHLPFAPDGLLAGLDPGRGLHPVTDGSQDPFLDLPPPCNPCNQLVQDSFLDEGFILDKRIGVGQPKRIEDAKILVANTGERKSKVFFLSGAVAFLGSPSASRTLRSWWPTRVSALSLCLCCLSSEQNVWCVEQSLPGGQHGWAQVHTKCWVGGWVGGQWDAWGSPGASKKPRSPWWPAWVGGLQQACCVSDWRWRLSGPQGRQTACGRAPPTACTPAGPLVSGERPGTACDPEQRAPF